MLDILVPWVPCKGYLLPFPHRLLEGMCRGGHVHAVVLNSCTGNTHNKPACYEGLLALRSPTDMEELCTVGAKMWSLQESVNFV